MLIVNFRISFNGTDHAKAFKELADLKGIDLAEGEWYSVPIEWPEGLSLPAPKDVVDIGSLMDPHDPFVDLIKLIVWVVGYSYFSRSKAGNVEPIVLLLNPFLFKKFAR